VNLGDDRTDFESLTKNQELWEEVINSSGRNAVLIAAAAFDTHLERILEGYLLQNSSVSNKLINSTLKHFASRIDACFCLGLISEDERHDLNLLRDIRNAFAHNLFGCDFSNPKVAAAVSNLTFPKKAHATPDKVDLKTLFNIGMVILDGLLLQRLQTVIPVSACRNTKFGKG